MITGQAKRIGLDKNGNIIVESEYTLTDGSKKTANIRYNALNFSRESVEKDIQDRCVDLLKKTWLLKQHQELILTKIDDISYQCDSAIIIVKPEVRDKNGVIIQQKETLTIDDK